MVETRRILEARQCSEKSDGLAVGTTPVGRKQTFGCGGRGEERERERGPCYSWRFTNLEMRKPFGFQPSVSALCFLQPLIKEENLISWLRTTGNIYTWVNHFDPSFLSNIKILFDPLRILRVISYFYCIVTNI